MYWNSAAMKIVVTSYMPLLYLCAHSTVPSDHFVHWNLFIIFIIAAVAAVIVDYCNGYCVDRIRLINKNNEKCREMNTDNVGVEC